MRDILTDESKLSIRCDEIDVKKQNKEMREIILALKEVIREKNITSLVANQIGYDKRIIVIRFGENDLRTFINPIITQAGKLTLAKEQCSSIPGKQFIRPRHQTIEITYQTPLGKIQSSKLMGKTAIVFQHCFDHLEGILLSDIGLEVGEEFEQATEEEREEIIKMYMDSLDMRTKEINKEIENDPELKQIKEGIDFMTAVQKGEVQVTYEQKEYTEEEKELLKQKQKEYEEYMKEQEEKGECEECQLQ